MIFTLTDFGVRGPYLGEMRAVLARLAPQCPVIDLMSDLPAFAPRYAAYLVDALVRAQPSGSVFVCVVDPGVGTKARRAVWVEAGARLLVGPDNGLMQVAAARARRARWHEILWRPRGLSASFHGRDLFAPVAARLAREETVSARRLERRSRFSARWPEDLDCIVYVDGFGNAITGRRSCAISTRTVVEVAGVQCRFARTFGEARDASPFWYRNSMGLVEVAIRDGNVAEALGIGVGTAIRVRAR